MVWGLGVCRSCPGAPRPQHQSCPPTPGVPLWSQQGTARSPSALHCSAASRVPSRARNASTGRPPSSLSRVKSLYRLCSSPPFLLKGKTMESKERVQENGFSLTILGFSIIQSLQVS